MEILKPVSDFGNLEKFSIMSEVLTVIEVCLEIGIFESLVNKQDSLQLSKNLKLDIFILEPILDLLTHIKLLEEREKKYYLTLLSEEYLTKNSYFNQLFVFGKQHKTSHFKTLYNSLLGRAKDKKSTNNKKYISDMFRINEQVARLGSINNLVSFLKNKKILERASKLCDLGGNSGYFSLALIKENPSLIAHIYDLPEVCEQSLKIKKNEDGFENIHYHGVNFDLTTNIGSDYDLFLVSNFCYKLSENDNLVNFLKKINKSLKKGGMFISNHFGAPTFGFAALKMKVIEIRSRLFDLKSHQIKENIWREALAEAGFGEIDVWFPSNQEKLEEMIVTALKI